MSLLIRFTHGVFWTVLGTAGARLFSLITAIAVARLLGKETFGELAMLQSTLGLLGVFAGFGLGLTATKHLAELRFRDPRRCGRLIALAHLAALVCGSFMTVVCFAAAPWLARTTLNAPHLAAVLQLGSPLLLVSALFGVFTGCLAGFQAFRSIARVNLYQALLALPLTLTLVSLAGLAGAMLALVAAALAGMGLSFAALRRECRNAGIVADVRGSLGERRTLWDFSFPALLSTSLVSPVTWAVCALLVQQPGGYAQLGLFNAADQFRVALLFIPHTLGMVAVPLLSERYDHRHPEHFARLTNLNLIAVWTAGLSLAFVFIGLSPWLLALFGPQFHQGRSVLAIMVCVAVLHLANGPVGQALISSGRMWAACALNFAWASILLLAAYGLVPALGAPGLALAYWLAYVCLDLGAFLFAAGKFGRKSVQHVPRLSLLTGLLVIFSLSLARLPQSFAALLSLMLSLGVALVGWRLAPAPQRQQLLTLIQDTSDNLRNWYFTHMARFKRTPL